MPTDVVTVPRTIRCTALLKVDAGGKGDASNEHVELDERVYHASDDPDCFCVRIEGDLQAPALQPGWYVVVEPNRQVALGDWAYVVWEDRSVLIGELLYVRGSKSTLLSPIGSKRTVIDSDLALDQSERPDRYAIAALLPPGRRVPHKHDTKS